MNTTDAVNYAQRYSPEARSNEAYAIRALLAEIKRLRTIVDKHLYQRRCWECKHIGYYSLDFLPFCQCGQCGGADTRRIEAAYAAGSKP